MQTNKVILDYLENNKNFQEFSKRFLEYEEQIPKTFGDARLASDFNSNAGNQKKDSNASQKKKKTGGVFDAGFG